MEFPFRGLFVAGDSITYWSRLAALGEKIFPRFVGHQPRGMLAFLYNHKQKGLDMGLDDCIEWEGSRFTRGYGRAPGGKYAHREAFFQAYGFYPTVVRHRCDNPPCVNPAHLLAGTQRDNLQDMFDRGRARRARGDETANGAKGTSSRN